MQDALRFAAVACGRPAVAVASDLVWLAGLVALIPLLRSASSSLVMILWLASAAVALIVAIVGLGVRPSLADGLADLRTRHRTGESISFGTVVTTGASLVVVGVAGAALGPAAVGSLRGASTVHGSAQRRLRLRQPGPDAGAGPAQPTTRPEVLRGDRGGCPAGRCGVVGSSCSRSPGSWGHALLGETWSGTRSVLPFTATEYAGIGLATASTLGPQGASRGGDAGAAEGDRGGVTVALGCAAALVFDDVRAVAAAWPWPPRFRSPSAGAT